MSFLFRLDLSLHVSGGKKFGILIFASKHGRGSQCWDFFSSLCILIFLDFIIFKVLNVD